MVSTTTHVQLAGTPVHYPIQVGSGLLATLGARVQACRPQATRVLVVSDTVAGPLFQDTVETALRQAGLTVKTVQILPGEAHKTLATVETLYDAAFEMDLKRRDVVLALGGGIVGDIAGLLAATYLRGVPFFQVPTTLLAQVDASVGGKVAVNWRSLKNMIGAFYQPCGVLIDPDTLKTLPGEVFAAGMAEVIKYSLLEGCVPGPSPEKPLWELLHQPLDATHPVLPAIISRCCALKARVVEADPEERHGIREILNLGHTFAHADETLSEGRIAHGQAVAVGMVRAMETAIALGKMPDTARLALCALLVQHHLPTRSLERFSVEQRLFVMTRDKKALGGESLRLVLPEGRLGHVRVQDHVPRDVVEAVLQAADTAEE